MNQTLIPDLKIAFNKIHVGTTSFRPLERCDAFPLFEATRNTEFNKFLLWHAPENEDGIVIQVDKLIRESTLNRSITLSLCERKTGTWIGLVRLQAYADGMEMGLMLHPQVWSTGVVANAGRAVIQTLLEHAGKTSIYVRVRPGNIRMDKICSFYHFELAENVTDTHAQDGTVDLRLFKLNKDLWKKYEDSLSY
jgi:RimJ/RimL family protein N-acetyltransferase